MLKLFRSLMPREDNFFGLFERHAAVVLQGARELVALLKGEGAIEAHCQAIMAYENEADDVTRDVLQLVRKSFITPFDRSAITGLINSMDDAIDQMNQTAKTITLFEITTFRPYMVGIGETAVRAAETTVDMLPLLRSVDRNAARLNELTEHIIHLEGEADGLHDAGLKELYAASGASAPMAFIVGRDIYSHLEKVLDRFEDVADEVQGLVLDHA